jgi:hypothetical protein
MALSVLRMAELQGQSGGKDLPPGFRTLAGVTLNRDSAATIRAKLGPTSLRRIGKGNDARMIWCYVSTKDSGGALLELMSDVSNMGTLGAMLNVIRLRADASPEDRRRCKSLRDSAELSTPAGLRLGLGLARIEALLGQPQHRSADSLTYYFDAKEYLRADSPEYAIWNTPEHRESCFDAGLPYANVAATIIVVLRDDRAVEIRVARYNQSIC